MLNFNSNIIGSQRDRVLRNAPPLPFGDFYIQLQVVAGGGAGSADIGAGGGAGGVRNESNYLINDLYTYSVVVGEGRDGIFQDPWSSDPPVQSNVSGSNSFFINNNTGELVDAWGGGCAGTGVLRNGNKGGSGGGGGGFSGNGGPAAGPNLANAGGNGAPSPIIGGGGGGGASTAGKNGTGGNDSEGGDGVAILGFNSESQFVGGGGAGGKGIPISGGIGGGGDSGVYTGNPATNIPPQKGQPNTGGGGGGIYGVPTPEYTSSFNTGGGSGIVVIFYKGIQQAIGGEVETRELNDGFYTQHVFTASGQFLPVAH